MRHRGTDQANAGLANAGLLNAHDAGIVAGLFGYAAVYRLATACAALGAALIVSARTRVPTLENRPCLASLFPARQPASA
jgi:hypothetical protein